MDKFTYCAYCAQRFPVDEDAALVSQHIATCPKHPMRVLESACRKMLEAWDCRAPAAGIVAIKDAFNKLGIDQ